MVVHSATLAINEQMAALHAAGKPGLHLGFGEAGLPVHPDVARVLAGAVARSSYAPVAGTAQARAAAAGYFTRRGLTAEPDQIVFGPGSKSLIYALLATLPGDVVLARPSWVSYAPQVELTGKQVIGVPIPDQAGGVPDPAALEGALDRATEQGLRPGVMVLTAPDNPTGTVASPELIQEVVAVAERHDLAIVSDEIYRDLCYQPSDFLSPATVAPERCFVTSGLSKSMALGGWRVGFARFPAGELGERTLQEVIGLASEIWSSMADPMQEVAAYVLDEPPEVVGHIVGSRRLHARVALAVHAEFVSAGALCRPPTGGFYVYPDLEPLRPALEASGITGGSQLASHLLERHSVGVLAGEAFGDDPARLRFRAATSLLYGATAEERWRALGSDDPVQLPWIAESLERLNKALSALSA